MRPQTRLLYTSMLATIASLNGVTNATEQFTVEPSVQQKLESKIQESSEFLGRINILPVDELKGEVIGVGVNNPLASRKNTDGGAPRVTTDPHGLTDRTYECVKINSDTHIKYATLDTWAKFPDFETRVRDAIVKRQALDRILIGWEGRYAAANSDKATFPLLQDVAKGWLQHIREEAPAQVMGYEVAGGVLNVDEAATHNALFDSYVAAPIRVGPGGTYANLDALVYDATQLLAPWYQENTDLVVICGRKLLHDKYFPVINQENKPTETLAADIVVSQKRIGGLPAVRVPGFPANGLMITTLKNLSIYYQDGKRRRHIKDTPELDRICDYQSSNDAYVVEDYDNVALVENIELIEADDA